ncbi:hypothetical protein [Pseudoxanthomonas wuyuanensis]|uniref:hypothetical protein n=1 Tax=Pseudoxanthomonas wuyuanensis TaxID=1073196 RepID=UPI0011433669|nr:hypothetical protein [Pseudoxanthomonas wuyuanensis]
MTNISVVQGQEFDWFARDSSGALALFATAGNGAVPDCVLEALELHGSANDLIPVTGWGSPQVWASYAAAGLFAYDWHEPTGQYCRVATPGGSVLSSLMAELVAVRLPEFSGHFSQALELSLEDLQHGA